MSFVTARQALDTSICSLFLALIAMMMTGVWSGVYNNNNNNNNNSGGAAGSFSISKL